MMMMRDGTGHIGIQIQNNTAFNSCSGARIELNTLDSVCFYFFGITVYYLYIR